MKKILIIAIVAVFATACEKPFDYNVAAVGKGLQLHVPAFPIPANYEREWFMRLPLGNTEKVYVTGYEVKMREGTHHFIAYPFSDEKAANNPPVGVMRDQNLPNGKLSFRSNMSSNIFLLETTAPDYKIDLPGGYAIPFEGGATLDFNSHYYNKTAKTRFGEIYMNVYTKPKSEIKGELDLLFMSNSELLKLPANQKTTVSYTEKVTEDMRLVFLTSHTHKHGEKFEIYGVGGELDGKLLYSSTDYVHPVINYYEKPIVIKKGDGLKSVITYNNTTNRAINYGVTSEDEMGMIFGYFVKN
jgi:Copper type II ascorbate-dependent monooxygenase, C-terminal domain